MILGRLQGSRQRGCQTDTGLDGSVQALLVVVIVPAGGVVDLSVTPRLTYPRFCAKLTWGYS